MTTKSIAWVMCQVKEFFVVLFTQCDPKKHVQKRKWIFHLHVLSFSAFTNTHAPFTLFVSMHVDTHTRYVFSCRRHHKKKETREKKKEKKSRGFRLITYVFFLSCFVYVSVCCVCQKKITTNFWLLFMLIYRNVLSQLVWQSSCIYSYE
jgi:hypothetical protein